MNTAMLAQAALRQRQKIVRNSQQEHIVESGPRTAKADAAPSSQSNSSVPLAGTKKPTAIPAGTPRPEKPEDWQPPKKKYGGFVPAVVRGKPDLSFLAHAVSNSAQERKKKISDPNYDWKVTLFCDKACCNFLRDVDNTVHKEEVKLKHTVTNAKKPMQFNPNQAILAGVSLKKAPTKPSGPKTETPEDKMANMLKGVSLKKATGRRVKDQPVVADVGGSNERVPPLISSVPPLISSVPPLISTVPPLVSSTPPRKKVEPKPEPPKAVAPPPTPQACTAVFTNTGSDPSAKDAVLYYEQTRWKDIGFTEPPLAITTYPGHRWYIKAGDTVLREFIVGQGNLQQFNF